MIENSNICMKGEIIDRIYDTKGNLIEERKGENLVVNSFLDLIACLLKNTDGFEGIQYWAIGSGDDSWDLMDSIPSPTLGDTKLEYYDPTTGITKNTEIGRVAISNDEITFLNDDFSTATGVTHILQIKHTFDENTCNGPWREFGIFGGNATSSPDSGYMINHRTHALLTKSSEMIVDRIMRFTLSLGQIN